MERTCKDGGGITYPPHHTVLKPRTDPHALLPPFPPLTHILSPSLAVPPTLPPFSNAPFLQPAQCHCCSNVVVPTFSPQAPLLLFSSPPPPLLLAELLPQGYTGSDLPTLFLFLPPSSGPPCFQLLPRMSLCSYQVFPLPSHLLCCH